MTTAPVNIGFVGAGEQAWESRIPAALALGDLVAVTAIADVDLAKAQGVADRFGIRHVHASAAEMIAGAESRGEPLHGVVSAIPARFAARVGVEVVTAGIPLLTEKPIADRLAAGETLVRTAHAAGVLLAVGYQMPFGLQEVFGEIEAGSIGTVRTVDGWWIRPAGIPDRQSFWDTDRGAGNDLLGHLLSCIVPIVGRPQLVSGHTTADHGRRRYGDLFRGDDVMTVELVCEGGQLVRLRVAWDDPARAHEEIGLEVRGSGGAVRLPLPGAELSGRGRQPIWFDTEGVMRFGAVPLSTDDCLVAQMRDWVEAIRGEHPLRFTPDLALTAQRIADAAYDSAAAGGRQIEI